jgi:hypothetical protein
VRISVRRTGGFAGIEEDLGAVDTAALAPDETERLERLVHDAGFFDLPAAVEGEVGADQFRYEVTVEEGGRTRTVTLVGEGGGPAAALRELVDAVGES